MESCMRIWWKVVLMVVMVQVATAEPPESVKQLVEKWRVAWNTADSAKLATVYHEKSFFSMYAKEGSKRFNERLGFRLKFYGKIKAAKVSAYFPKANRCLALVDFDKVKGYPIVFELKTSGAGFLLADETFGIDPTEKRDDAKINAYAKQWIAAVNGGSWKAIRGLSHSKSDFLMTILMSKAPEKEAAAEFSAFLKEMGMIKVHAIKGFRKNTSEYIVEFDYAKRGKLAATIILKKDADGKFRCSRMDIDDGARALKDPDGWRPK